MIKSILYMKENQLMEEENILLAKSSKSILALGAKVLANAFQKDPLWVQAGSDFQDGNPIWHFTWKSLCDIRKDGRRGNLVAR